MASKLTEANFYSRKLKLEQALIGARRAYDDAAFRREMDDATDADVIAAKADVTALEERVVGLIAAWNRTVTDHDAAAKEAKAKSVEAAHRAIVDKLAARKKASDAMEDAALALTERYAENKAAGRAIVLAAAVHADVFGSERVSHLRELIDGNFNDVRGPLGRLLSINGLNLANFTNPGYPTDSEVRRSVRAFTEWSNARIVGHVEPLAKIGGA